MDNPVYIPEEMNGYSPSAADKMRSSNPRLSHYYRSPSSHHSSSSGGGSSHRNLIPPSSSSYYYQAQPEYPLPASTMWHLGGRYREDELPNIPSNMAAAMYPRFQNPHMHIPNRRFSVAAMPPSHNDPYAQMPQRRRISVTKYLDIPETNYLKVPKYQDGAVGVHQINHQYEPPSTLDYVEYNRMAANPLYHSKTSSRRRSEGSLPKVFHTKESKTMSREFSNSRSSDLDAEETSGQPPALEEVSTPDPTKVPVPAAFEFNSSHLPLRPPVVIVNKYSAGSGSTSTPDSQRIESRQMIRSSNSKAQSPKIEMQKESRKDNGSIKALSDRKIWSITKPTQWCRHGAAKKCKHCNMKMETMSQCSSVNPPPTFTALDNYRPVKKKNKCSCSCGVVFRISIILAVIVMLFIAAFILYVEMVLKHQTDNVMDKM